MTQKKDEFDYKSTLHLPQTDFPMKANLAQREPEFIRAWDEKKLYSKILQKNQQNPRFVLHDGPPYANGSIHFGHILNKTLKDIIVKYKNLSGFCAEYVPGWDCHGLPIELQVDKELGPKKKDMSVVGVRQACRQYAQKYVDIQKGDFQRLGIFARWDEPYLTMNYDYEATIAKTLAELVRRGYVYKGAKPVHWCMHCQTALAEAEVEYENHLSPSIYVKFENRSDLSGLIPQLNGKKIYWMIWTTTPWTLPANLALAVNRQYTYVAIQVGDEVLIVAEGLLEALRQKLNFQEDKLLARIPGAQLEGFEAQHPFLNRRSQVVLSDHVTLDAGTGIVHIAPGHGQEDYDVGRRYGLPVLNPVDHQGKFTQEVGLEDLVGVFVLKANAKIIEILKNSQALMKAEELQHSYPHCWRCKSPVIFRSTPQYFISMSHEDLRGKSLDAIRRVEWVPPWGRDRIYGMIENRPDWCISRQRSWGVPIMGFRCEDCGQSLLKAEILEHIAKRFETEGADAYFRYSEAELLPTGTTCEHCHSSRLVKEKDILDVWFDSGVSFAAVLEKRAELGFPANLYLEGSDQHRGWFHSSLLASMGARDQAPYRSVLTHGFVVDGQGKKYSKSAKNYAPPDKIIQEAGAEILRLWVAAEDYKNDIRISTEILDRLKETYRKIRNTIRFLLGNLFDFNPGEHQVPLADRTELDRWAMSATQDLIKRVGQAYEDYEFHILYHALNQFCTVTLSAFYLDILKDRLYVAKKDSLLRRSAQSTLYDILMALLPMMAPVLSFTSEEAYRYLPYSQAESIYLLDFPKFQKDLIDTELVQRFEKIFGLRREVLKALEIARQEKKIGHSLEAQVRIAAEGEMQKFLLRHKDFWPECFIVSQVVVVYEIENPTYEVAQDSLKIEIRLAEGEKCSRCWMRTTTVGKNIEHPQLCERCNSVLS